MGRARGGRGRIVWLKCSVLCRCPGHGPLNSNTTRGAYRRASACRLCPRPSAPARGGWRAEQHRKRRHALAVGGVGWCCLLLSCKDGTGRDARCAMCAFTAAEASYDSTLSLRDSLDLPTLPAPFFSRHLLSPPTPPPPSATHAVEKRGADTRFQSEVTVPTSPLHFSISVAPFFSLFLFCRCGPTLKVVEHLDAAQQRSRTVLIRASSSTVENINKVRGRASLVV